MADKYRDYDIVPVSSEHYDHLEKPIKINTQAFLDELSKAESSIIIELFEIDTRRYSGEILRFHNGKTIQGDIVFNSKTYKSFPFEVSEFEIKGDGSLPRPKLTFANIDGYVSQLIQGKDDFVGLSIKRTRTFLKYIDSKNFVDNINPFGKPDSTARFPDDEFVINQKVQEDKNLVTFELVSVLDLEEARVPTRIMYSHYCPWTYRGIGCSYGNKQIDFKFSEPNCAQARGLPVADEYDKAFAYDYKFSSDGNASWQNSSSAYIYSGYYDSTGIYSSGDWVKIANLDQKDINYELIYMAKPTGFMAKEYPETSTSIPFYNVSGKDPRFDKENWVQDQCSKTLSGCAIRFQKSENGLPFGGFPGIDKYKYK
jgi:lambda family phage minor tail protein L